MCCVPSMFSHKLFSVVLGLYYLFAQKYMLKLIKLHLAKLIAKFVVSRCVFCKLQRNFGFFCSVNHLGGPLSFVFAAKLYGL